ncbi:unnamed protein product [Parnassius mnemosyne]|uniref:HTH CENPB-type domain-containing protein n=1 Tax=Parnassius mnemosyne TaxID=213953 RepID=A0AAV1KL05_9NEOP
MAPTRSKGEKRGQLWTEGGLQAAMNAVQRGQLSQRAAASRHNIPRRTLRDHLKRKHQENDLVERIKRFAKIGVPLTPKFIRKQAYMFCETYKIKNNFNNSKRIAGTDWLRYFLKRNPSISKRKPQIMNPARAQKLNKPIVQQHFQSVQKLYNEMDILQHPQKLYNMDEKGCRITVHKQNTVLAEKGSKRVHLIAPEHAENVTIAMCVNAIGTAIPPMILFKGKRQRPDLCENLPAGTLVRMAPKGSMTADLFLEFIKHLAKYKVAGKCLLIFDGAKCHLSIEVLDEADKNNIVLYCLPSNTTHELQPLDKSVNKSYEHHWDEAVLNFLYTNPDRTMSKTTFNRIFSQVWPKCITHSNIVNGFAATGLFPFNPEAIPEEAYAPSVLSEIACPQTSVEPIQSPISGVILNDDTDDDLPICDWLLQNSTSDVLELDEYPGLNQPTDLGPIVPSTTENFPRVKRRLVDYSSSPDVSDLEMLENPHGTATQVGEHCASPSLIPENDVLLVSANDEPLLDNEDNYKIDLGVPSCSGLHRAIRPSSSSDSTISD